ncbi:FtsX-like permease family protein [bacterium]|nr:MAG: FtsX-like permease family protein [bacterium]
MIKNYLKTAFRRLERNKSFALINIAGLSLGITCALIIFLLVKHELSFDGFHSKKDRIYRVNTVWTRDGEVDRSGASQFPVAAAIRSQFSDLKATMINYVKEALIAVPNGTDTPSKFQENEGVVYIEPDFFDIFDRTWFRGHPSLLKEPYTVALSESTAKKFFPNENPVGKTIRMNSECDLKVIGVVTDPPVNTDFPFTVLISYSTQKALGYFSNMENWGATMSFINTYIFVPEIWSAASFNERLTAFAKTHLDERKRKERSYEVQSLSDVHFDPDAGNYTHVTSRTSIWALSIIAFFLIVTACINFINLATAQAVTRSKEIGVRKVLGAFRAQLLIQFLGETFVITFLAIVLSIGMTEMILPLVNDAFSFNIRFNLFNDPLILLFLAGLAVVITAGSGFYPALMMAGYSPVSVLKGGQSSKAGGLLVRKGLVVLQFMIAQALVIGTIVVFRQMDLFQTTDMGFIKDAIITTNIPVKDKSKMQTLRNEIMKETGVQNVTFGFAQVASGMRWTSMMIYRGPAGKTYEALADVRCGDEFYIPTYGIQMLAGRNFTASDSIHELVINETMAQKIGFTNPADAVGKIVYVFGSEPKPIVGVVKDFNTGSLRASIYPTILAPRSKDYRIMGVKIDMKRAKILLPKIEAAWAATYPEFLYRSQFLDESIAGFYEDEQKISRLFTIFASIAIGIGCLGLFGLVSFMAVQRTKEIGVRKVLGASVSDILMMFTKEFAVLILIAFLIAAPAAYVVMNGWLEDFAYRISIGAEVFFTAVMLTIIISGVTVGYRSIKAASANPVDVLKYE